MNSTQKITALGIALVFGVAFNAEALVSKEKAIDACQKYVKEQMTIPETAKFSTPAQMKAFHFKKNEYIVSGFVDGQKDVNTKFHRTHYSCTTSGDFDTIWVADENFYPIGYDCSLFLDIVKKTAWYCHK